MHKYVNNIVKTKFWFDEYNGNFGKMIETEIIKHQIFKKKTQSENF